jgi:phage tail-like protein
MDGDREISLLADPDQWARCAHTSTALLDDGGVELSWEDEPAPPQPRTPPDPCAVEEGPSGLAFDRWCRAYRSRPVGGRVELLPRDGLSAAAGARAHHPGPLRAPRGLGVDRAQRLYVAESGAGAVHVVDLWAHRLLRRVSVRSGRHRSRQPVDLAGDCCEAVVLVRRPTGLLVVAGRRGPLPGPELRRPACHGRRMSPVRVTARDGLVLVLWTGPDGDAVVASPDGAVAATTPYATDLELTGDGVLVVARAPGQSFRRFRRVAAEWVEAEPVGAPDYDGGAISVAPDGRVAFTTAAGFGWTTGSAARHRASGRVVTYRLDALGYSTRWGRLFLDACIPPGTDVRARFLTSDEDDVPDPLPWTAADRGQRTVRAAELTPPLPSQVRLREIGASTALHRRATGSELPWEQRADEAGVQTYEAPVLAPPGRYLWVVLELTGTGRTTPRVRALRVERPGHRLGARLPRSWTRQEPDAAFLQRLLAPAEGLLHDLDQRAALRAVLLDPAATPEEALGWLGSLLGLALDRRWTLAARRALVGQAFELFRIRGTQACLERLLGLYLDMRVPVVETWRLRGLSGAVLGPPPEGAAAPAVLGATRTAGSLGHFTVGGVGAGEDGYRAAAHRFSVLITTDLSAEQREVVRRIVEDHKPAHTLVQICELGAGMRVGRQLHLSLTSVVGPGSGWEPIVVGQVLLGADGIIGIPSIAARVGETSVAGAVRVG